MILLKLITEKELLGVSVAQQLGRWTSELTVIGLIPNPHIIRHICQLSLLSLWGR